MNFQLDLNCSVEESVKSIASQIVENAVLDCSSDELSDNEKIHFVRKKCKRIRALIRIVRPKIGRIYKDENIFFRDLGRKLSETRDAQVYIDTLEKIYLLPINSNISEYVRTIINQFEKQRDSIESVKLLNEFIEEIKNSQLRITQWKIKGNGFKCLEGSLKKTYRRGRTAMKTVSSKPTIANYHEWRKRAKYHYHQLELIVPIWEKVLQQFAEEAHRLSEMLGYDHDLSLLKEKLLFNFQINSTEEAMTQLISSIDDEQSELRLKILSLGEKVYAEKPRHLVRRIKKYWNSCQNQIE